MASPKPFELLRDALDAARAALRDLEADEVPAKVRRVASSSERTLPPPLAMSLLRELGSDEFLRSKALEAWEGEPPGSGPAMASYAFLQREPGWESTLIVEALALGERHGAASDRSGELERESLAAEVASLKEQMRRLRQESTAREQELRAELEAERAPGRADRQAEQRAIARLEQERSSWQQTETSLRDRIEELESEARRFKEVARAERSARSEIAARLDSSDVGGLPSDPVELARLLDDVASHAMALAPAPEASAAGAGTVPVAPLVFEASLRPDRAEAVDWLIRSSPARVLIDGYNLGFALAGLDPGRARALTIEAVGRLAAVAPATDFTIVFDSTLEPVDDEDLVGGRSGNVVIEFTVGTTADDAIVARAASTDRLVVITNDRELRHRTEAEGAITLWSDALVEWSRRR